MTDAMNEYNELKRNPIGKAQEFFNSLPRAEVGGLLREYIAEAEHMGWDGFDRRDRTGVRKLLADLVIYYWNRGDHGSFATEVNNTNPITDAEVAREQAIDVVVVAALEHTELLEEETGAVSANLTDEQCKAQAVERGDYDVEETERETIRVRDLKRAIDLLRPPKPEATNFVFVYGTLKRNFGNHRRIALSDEDTPAQDIGDAVSVDTNYCMSNHGFPVLWQAEAGHAVRGEVYRLSDKTLTACDHLEGHPHFYCREQRQFKLTRSQHPEFDDGMVITAWVYLAVNHERSNDVVQYLQPDEVLEWGVRMTPKLQQLEDLRKEYYSWHAAEGIPVVGLPVRSVFDPTLTPEQQAWITDFGRRYLKARTELLSEQWANEVVREDVA